MVLDVEDGLLGHDTSLLHDLPQVTLELLHAVLSVDVGREEFDVEQVANELG